MGKTVEPEPEPEPGRSTPGRRQVRAAGRVRPHAHRVKVTAEQETRLVELAGARGITVARLLVESALAGGAASAAERAGTMAELIALGNALGRVGVNVNQIARATNASGEVQSATAATLGAVREVAARLAVALDGLDEARAGRRVRAVPS